jgi:hypothetical protein
MVAEYRKGRSAEDDDDGDEDGSAGALVPAS